MQVKLLFLLLCSIGVNCFKFLAYNPQFGSSHVNFISRLSDALIDEGHEVVMVSPQTDTLVGKPKTRARVIEVPQAPLAAKMQNMMNAKIGGFTEIWLTSNVFSQMEAYRVIFAGWKDQCGVTLVDQELLESLRAENFDGAFTESLDSCGYGIFHLLDITKYATTVSLAVIDGCFALTQIPANTAYVPSLMGGSAGDRMSFFDRLYNTLAYLKRTSIMISNQDLFQDIFDAVIRDPPNVREMMRKSSFVFMNSDPLADFPRLTSPRVIDIGGISVHAGHNQLDEYWSGILNRRNQTVFISFGTFVKSHLMPEPFKETIRETMKKFPDVTFIWKYEKPEHNISLGIDNLIETTWAPQHDLLHDPRMTAFVTHGGQGSITESAGAGIPLICIPIVADQLRNARQVERNGVGIMLNKADLGRMGPLEEAIRNILADKSYKSNAVLLSQMIADRPFNMKDVFVKKMEFMVKYGPLTRLDHYGAQLPFIQYYLIDVFSFIALVVISSLLIVLYILKLLVSYIPGFRIVRRKDKRQ